MNEYHGNGKLFDKNGALIYDGGFYMGKYDGKGREFYPKGELKFEGSFKLGEYGDGTFYNENGEQITDEETLEQLRNH